MTVHFISPTDIPSTNRNSDIASVLIDDGQDGFDHGVTYNFCNAPNALLLADVEDDGVLELFTGSVADETISVLLRTDNSNFGPKPDFTMAEAPTSITARNSISDGKASMHIWLAALGLLTTGMGTAQATPTLTTLFSFNGTNGANLQASLILDASGNLFGTSASGGSSNVGTVFQLAKGASAYTFSSLFSFNGTNGRGPFGELLRDSAGNFYTTTSSGGSLGEGNVIKLTKGTASYTVSTLASFTGTGAGRNGSSPHSGLLADGSGNLFGTTVGGGTTGYGTVFELVKSGSTYTTTTLANLSAATGGNPFATLIVDSSGNLFGTTNGDGPGGYGTVFELARTGTGYGPLVTLASFNITNGANPYGALLLDSSGNLFGTTYDGGSNNAGTVFKLTKGASSYTLSTLAAFDASSGYVDGGLIMDAAGNLFGTTLGNLLASDGSRKGTVFELAKGASSYALNTLVTFNGANGAAPYASLIADASGNLFGTTSAGGASNKGTVFRVSDSGYVPAASTLVAEPASLSVLAAGLLGALVRRRRLVDRPCH